MATIEEVRSKLKDRLGKFKVQTPTRVAYLGDGRGNATSNMVPVGEPNKFWARESLDGDKPFKITNKNPNLTPAFNLPVLLGYPEHDPETEQVLGLHSALIKLDAGGNVSGSSIGGTSPHHQKHEWGGGDTVYVDPRMFKPGLVVPTTPVSMRVKVLAFQHYYNFWRRYDGGVSPDLSQYIPDSDYRYVMLCLDPDTNQLVIHPGSVFTPDLSIDSIISNAAQNTFRHIPVPPGNEIPLAAILLEPSTTKINWNPEGVNNLMPMRLLLSTPLKEVNERLSTIESRTGLGTLPQTGAAQSVDDDLLPGRIDGNRTRLVLARNSLSPLLPTLLVGELAYINDSPSAIVVGTASGNKTLALTGGGGGGGATALSQLSDVSISDLTNWRTLQYDPAIGSWQASSAVRILDLAVGACPIPAGTAASGEISVLVADEQGFRTYAMEDMPTTMYADFSTGLRIGGEFGTEKIVEINPDNDVVDFRVWYLDDIALSIDAEDYSTRLSTATYPSALFVDYGNENVQFRGAESSSPIIHVDYDTEKVGIGTSVPGEKLDVIGITQSSEGFKTSGCVLVSKSSSTNDPFINLNQEGSGGYAYIKFSGTKGEGYVGWNNSVGGVLSINSGSPISINGEGAGIALDSGQITFDPGGYVSVVFETGANPAAIFNNPKWSNYDFNVKSGTNDYMLFVDSGLDAVQIGTSVLGQIADFRENLIEFNKNSNVMPVLVGTSTVDTVNNETALFQVGAPVDSNAFVAKMNGRLLLTRYGSGTLGTNVSYQPDTTDGNQLAVLGAATSTTGVGGTEFQPMGQIRALFSNHAHSSRAMSWTFYTSQGGGATERMSIGAGVQIGSPTGGDKGAGTINVSGNVYKNNTAYTNPDYALEHWATGRIEKFKDNDGAQGYYRLSIDESKEYVKKNLRLPRITDEPAGIFDMADIALEKIEEAHIYIYELHDRIKALEAKIAQMEKNSE